VVDALLAVEVALMHRVHPDVARASSRIGFASDADGDADAAGRLC